MDDVMKADIDARIDRAKDEGKLTQMRIDVVAMNSWLELGTGEVLPAEIGMITMTPFAGIHARFNQMIDPEVLPIGYKADAKINSEKYHQIWLDNEYLSNDYLQSILECLFPNF